MNLGLLGAIGGLGQGVSNLGQTMMKDIESREADERQRAIDTWKLQMQEEYAIKREERQAARAEAENKRTLDTLMASDENARKTLTEREFEKFKSDLGQTDATDEQLRAVFEKQYFDRSVAPGDAQSDRYNPRESDFIRQQRTEAAKLGASSGLLGTLYTQEKDTLSRERQAEADAQKRINDDRRWQAEQQRIDISDKRANAAITTATAAVARANRPDSTSEKMTERQKFRRDSLKDEKRNLTQDLRKLTSERETEVQESKRKAMDAQIAKIEARLVEVDQEITALFDEFEGKPAPQQPKPAEPKPQPLPPRSAGREALIVGTVYQTPRGAAKWDGKQFIPVN